MTFPHCDSNVLHAPGECIYCDKAPELQQKRIQDGVNFTGHRDPDKKPCPAEQQRPLEVINKWHGNILMTENEAAAARNRLFEKMGDDV